MMRACLVIAVVLGFGTLPVGNAKVTASAVVDEPGYTGHVDDAEMSLIYVQQRYYDSGVARFVSVDPVPADGATGGNFNRYSYGANNPLRFSDPDGRQAVDHSSKYLAEYDDCAATAGCSPQDVPSKIAQREKPFAEAAGFFVPVERALAFAGRLVGRVEVAKLVAAANVEFKGGLSVAARKLESHSQRIGGTFQKLSGTVAQKNQQAESVVRGILDDANAVRTELRGGGFEYRVGANGQGVRFNKDGSFNTFLDPRKAAQ